MWRKHGLWKRSEGWGVGDGELWKCVMGWGGGGGGNRGVWGMGLLFVCLFWTGVKARLFFFGFFFE